MRRDALAIGIADHRHDEAVRRVGGKADVEVALLHHVLAIEADVELREALQRAHTGLDQESEQRDFCVCLHGAS